MKPHVILVSLLSLVLVPATFAASTPVNLPTLTLTAAKGSPLTHDTVTVTDTVKSADVLANIQKFIGEIPPFNKKKVPGDVVTSVPAYILLNVVVWDKGDLKYSDWLVYNRTSEKASLFHTVKPTPSTVARILGSSSVGVLVVSTGLEPTQKCDSITYTVTAQHQLAQNIQDMQKLLAAVMQEELGTIALDLHAAPPAVPFCYAYEDLSRSLPSLPLSIVLTGAMTGDSAKPDKALGNTFVDEGYHYFDVSVGMPLAALKNVKYDSTNNTIVPTSTDKITPYAFADFYPFGADLTPQSNFLLQPKFTVGIPIGNRPLDYPFFGGGVMIVVKKFKIPLSPYAGITYEKVSRTRTLSAGDAADPATLALDTYTKRVARFSYGLSFSVTDALILFKNK
jgi:hypothetical protein